MENVVVLVALVDLVFPVGVSKKDRTGEGLTSSDDANGLGEEVGWCLQSDDFIDGDRPNDESLLQSPLSPCFEHHRLMAFLF